MTKCLTGGSAAETQLYQAFSVEYQKPEWFLGLELPSVVLDVRGVDALCRIIYPSTQEGLVPLQIKTDQCQVDEFYAAHPELYDAAAPVTIIQPQDKPDTIRERVFYQLKTIRIKGFRFEKVLHELEGQPLTWGGYRLAEAIERARAEQAGHLQERHIVASK